MVIETGIHFGLSDADYHGDPALGSTGLKALLQSAPDFWWNSPLNPAREPETETPAKFFGKAVHKCVLEGRTAFEAIYSPCEHPGNIKAGKDERADIAQAGKLAISRADYDRIQTASAFIRANPNLANAFQGGMPEVSVFWEAGGLRFKARFDFLKMNAISDLKSIRNPLGKEFKKACRDRIAELEYGISAEHYMDGRRQMKRLLADGRVFGEHDRDWLTKVAANEVFGFVFVFWQAEGAPISLGFKLSPGNPMLGYARSWISKAVDTYQHFVSEFGTDTAWVLAEPLDELEESEMPVWWTHRQNAGA